MPGFACIVGRNLREFPLPFRSAGFDELVRSTRQLENATVTQYTNSRFPHDKVFGQDEELLVVLEGVIFNLQQLRERYRCADNFQLVKALYRQHGEGFVSDLRGDFSGAIYAFAQRKWLIFTNHVASKPLYYFNRDGVFICASDLAVVTATMRELDIPRHLDVLGGYMMLTYGFFLEDCTPVREVRKLKPGHLIEVGPQGVSVRCYHRFETRPAVKDSKDGIIDQLDALFAQAVRREFDKDREYGYRHLVALSGGLDSRMTCMVARELGYDGICNLTFSQGGHFDERIARRIAADLGNEWLFYSLDNGTYLLDRLEDAVEANSGMVLWAGSAHMLAMLQYLSMRRFGMVHSGMSREGAMGKFVTRNEIVPPQPRMGTHSTRLLHRIEADVRPLVGQYESEELFILYSRATNCATNGIWTTQIFTEHVSPFMDVDFLEFMLAVPRGLKVGEAIYHDWILAKRPDVGRYVWARTKAPLGAGRMRKFVNKRLWRLWVHLPFGQAVRSMNPFEYWYRTNPRLRQYIEGHFTANIDRLADYPQLMNDCRDLFQTGTFVEKTQVGTLLETMRLHALK